MYCTVRGAFNSFPEQPHPKRTPTRQPRDCSERWPEKAENWKNFGSFWNDLQSPKPARNELTPASQQSRVWVLPKRRTRTLGVDYVPGIPKPLTAVDQETGGAHPKGSKVTVLSLEPASSFSQHPSHSACLVLTCDQALLFLPGREGLERSTFPTNLSPVPYGPGGKEGPDRRLALSRMAYRELGGLHWDVNQTSISRPGSSKLG